MIVIVDYDVGQSGSVHNMLRKPERRPSYRGQSEILAADKLILPGVGISTTAWKCSRRPV